MPVRSAMRRSKKFPAMLMAVYLPVLLLVGVTGALALLWHNDVSAARALETRSALEELVLSERLRGDLERTIAGARGFLLAGDQAALERVRAAEIDTMRELHDLHARTGTPAPAGGCMRPARR